MKKDLEQGRTVVAELLKSISSLKPISSTLSTISTTYPTKPQTSPTNKTIESSSSSHFSKKRENARMVVNYKKLNQFIKTGNYFPPNKEVLIILVKHEKVFLEV